MPHACTSCNRSFPDGSTEMLSGCPSCGGNRFQFIPDGASEPADDSPAGDIIEAESDPAVTAQIPAEDPAQADARSSLVEADELPRNRPDTGPPHAQSASSKSAESSPTDDRPADLGELREELEDRFESIKIVDRGEYELNLMELYERPECIIELGENGRYAIHVPETLSDVEAAANGPNG